MGPESAEESAGGVVPAASDGQLVAMLVDRARSEGLQLIGEGGLLQMLTKRVLESALEGEITDHVGYAKHDPAGKNNGNSRNGTRSKTVLTDVGPVGGERAARYRRRLRAAAGEEAAAPADRRGRDGAVAVRERAHARRDLLSLRAGTRARTMAPRPAPTLDKDRVAAALRRPP
jgi:hypothetical protein